jgi:hypothetical protein
MYYLAYGSNLNRRQMAYRCPAAVPIGTVIVPDMRLVFRGVADIEDHRGAELHCGVWKITKACERALDRYEGVSSGLYVREFKVLALTDRRGKERIEDALIYRMDASYYAPPGAEYLNAIAEGYRDFSLPPGALRRALEHVSRMDDDQLCPAATRRHGAHRPKPKGGRRPAPRKPRNGSFVAEA